MPEVSGAVKSRQRADGGCQGLGGEEPGALGFTGLRGSVCNDGKAPEVHVVRAAELCNAQLHPQQWLRWYI